MVSTRKVKAITEELCGQAFSASAISAVNKTLNESLERWSSACWGGLKTVGKRHFSGGYLNGSQAYLFR